MALLNWSVAPIFTLGCILGWVAWQYFWSPLDKVRGPPSHSLIKGNLSESWDPKAWSWHREITQKYGGVVKLIGSFGDRVLYVSDPKALHHIFMKEQDVYSKSPPFLCALNLFFGPNILSTIGQQHRRQKKMLGPAFSPAHLNGLVPIFYEVADKLRSAITEQVTLDGTKEVDVVPWMTSTALELIGQSGFGYSFESFKINQPPHPYSEAIKRLIPESSPLVHWRTYILPVVSRIGSPWFRRWLLGISPWERGHRLRDMMDLMYRTSVEIVRRERENLGKGEDEIASRVGHGKDIVRILMQNNEEAPEEDRLSDEEIIAQISGLTFAAMDTTSGALSRVLHLLSLHPEAQERLWAELTGAAAEYGHEIPFDVLSTLPYMDAICRETLRLYPPLPVVERRCVKDAILPLYQPIVDANGHKTYEVFVPNGTMILPSIIGANCDPSIWGPDSYEWKPDRWLKPLPESVKEARIPGIYSNLMTFISGARSCLGFKYSQLEMKVVLAVLVQNFRFAPPKDKDIYWEMNLIANPVVVGDASRKPSLPLFISLRNPVKDDM
ncbi:hypothetical protein AX16_003278 [Volvariella volvacea WC 439]|nr:hypothetical protein AX16_003278 [Volvariella volvacea WC 439]